MDKNGNREIIFSEIKNVLIKAGMITGYRRFTCSVHMRNHIDVATVTEENIDEFDAQTRLMAISNRMNPGLELYPFQAGDFN